MPKPITWTYAGILLAAASASSACGDAFSGADSQDKEDSGASVGGTENHPESGSPSGGTNSSGGSSASGGSLNPSGGSGGSSSTCAEGDCSCPPGTFGLDAEFSSCTPCPYGTYNDRKDALECQAWSCPPWAQAKAGSATQNAECKQETIKQFGTDAEDKASAVATDSEGNLYVAGYTLGLLGATSEGSADAFLKKLDKAGELIWIRQFGSNTVDLAKAVAVDAEDNVYVVGSTKGPVPGNMDATATQISVRKYDTNGTLAWQQELGSEDFDMATGVTVDSKGNIYLSGYTWGALPGQTQRALSDAFVIKLEPTNGDVAWYHQFGSDGHDYALGIASDVENSVYIVGTTSGILPGQTQSGTGDIILRKLNHVGTVVWTKQFGTVNVNYAEAIAVGPSGDVYIAGETNGTFPGQTYYGGFDSFLASISASGDLSWVRQFGTSTNDKPYAVATDSAGNIFVVGDTNGTVPEHPSFGGADAFARSFSKDGISAWYHQFGTNKQDHALAITTDNKRNLFIAGTTEGDLGGPNHGGKDAFVVQLLNPAP